MRDKMVELKMATSEPHIKMVYKYLRYKFYFREPMPTSFLRLYEKDTETEEGSELGRDGKEGPDEEKIFVSSEDERGTSSNSSILDAKKRRKRLALLEVRSFPDNPHLLSPFLYAPPLPFTDDVSGKEKGQSSFRISLFRFLSPAFFSKLR